MKQKDTDYVHALIYHSDKRMANFRALSVPERAAAFEQLSPYIQETILKQLKIYEIVDLLDHMDLQHVERVLSRIRDKKLRERVVKRLKGEVKNKLEYFLRFHPDASLDLINFNYLFLPGYLTIKEAAELIGQHYDETARYPEVLVHKEGQLLGEVPLSTIVRVRSSGKLEKFINPVQTIEYQSNVREVIELLVTTKSKKVIVLDHDTSVLGIIYAEAARSLFGNLPAESLYEFAGVDDSEQPFDPVRKKVTKRYRWLILNLMTAFLASLVILFFQDTLNELTILSVFIPVVAGMGGNAAAQTFAIMIRGLTLGTISLEKAGPAILREMMAGGINGVIIGSIVGTISFFWGVGLVLGLIVACALIGAHIVAGLAGAFIPLLMKHFGKDPATGATIFITTATDVCGIFFLLGLGTWILL
jgi:magnesium transporter